MGRKQKNVNETTYVVTENNDYEFIVEGSNGEKTTHIVEITNGKNVEKFSDIYAETKTYTDKNGNTAKIPKGFAVGISRGINTINEGLVITDSIDENHYSTGNQFVWIPVGDIKDAKGTIKTIELNRYTFASNGTASKQENNRIETYYQELATSSYGNTIAKDVEAFKISATINYGYYIGRYEMGKATTEDKVIENSTVVCKEGRDVYNYITEQEAATLARKMYPGSKNLTSITSDLINSYAWDTAIVFIQEFSGDNRYSRQVGLQNTLAKTGKATDGTNKDVRCNIYDMAGNYREWTTETCAVKDAGCTNRGGSYEQGYTSRRGSNNFVGSYVEFSFRTVIYL